MPIFESESLTAVAIHRVGNKANQEPLFKSNALLPTTDSVRDVLATYFVEPFKVQEYFHLYHPDGLDHNEIYRAAEAIFSSPDSLLEQSRCVAQLLYDASTHPNIKSGDLFVAYFERCQIDGTDTQAIGLFKAETHSQYLKVSHATDEAFRIDIDTGIDAHRLDKGALIFNIESEQGYVVSVVDNAGRGNDAAYWRDAFLGIAQRQDEYYCTHAELSAVKRFVTDELPRQFDGVSRADQADMLGKSVRYFKQNDSFDLQTFADEVIAQPEVIESFKEFRQQYQEETQMQLKDDFAISDQAVKKQARNLRSVIKLDKNFHIYVHGNRELIEQGEDERGKYYKVYYHDES